MYRQRLTKKQIAILNYLADGDTIYRGWQRTGNWLVHGEWGTMDVAAKSVDRLVREGLIRIDRYEDKQYLTLTPQGHAIVD